MPAMPLQSLIDLPYTHFAIRATFVSILKQSLFLLLFLHFTPYAFFAFKHFKINAGVSVWT